MNENYPLSEPADSKVHWIAGKEETDQKNVVPHLRLHPSTGSRRREGPFTAKAVDVKKNLFRSQSNPLLIVHQEAGRMKRSHTDTQKGGSTLHRFKNAIHEKIVSQVFKNELKIHVEKITAQPYDSAVLFERLRHYVISHRLFWSNYALEKQCSSIILCLYSGDYLLTPLLERLQEWKDILAEFFGKVASKGFKDQIMNVATAAFPLNSEISASSAQDAFIQSFYHFISEYLSDGSRHNIPSFLNLFCDSHVEEYTKQALRICLCGSVEAGNDMIAMFQRWNSNDTCHYQVTSLIKDIFTALSEDERLAKELPGKLFFWRGDDVKAKAAFLPWERIPRSEALRRFSAAASSTMSRLYIEQKKVEFIEKPPLQRGSELPKENLALFLRQLFAEVTQKTPLISATEEEREEVVALLVKEFCNKQPDSEGSHISCRALPSSSLVYNHLGKALQELATLGHDLILMCSSSGCLRGDYYLRDLLSALFTQWNFSIELDYTAHIALNNSSPYYSVKYQCALRNTCSLVPQGQWREIPFQWQLIPVREGYWHGLLRFNSSSLWVGNGEEDLIAKWHIDKILTSATDITE